MARLLRIPVGGSYRLARIGTRIATDLCDVCCDPGDDPNAPPVGNMLVFGGNFAQAGGVALTQNIAAWTGTHWRRLGGGFDGIVTSLAVFQGRLYAAGFFNNALPHGTIPNILCRRIARWNFDRWEPVGNGFNNNVQFIKVIRQGPSNIGETGASLIALGQFTAGGIGSPAMNRGAIYNEISNTWSQLANFDSLPVCAASFDLYPWLDNETLGPIISRGSIGGGFTQVNFANAVRAAWLDGLIPRGFFGDPPGPGGIESGLNGQAFTALHWARGTISDGPQVEHIFGGEFTSAFGATGIYSTQRLCKIVYDASRQWWVRDSTVRGFNAQCHSLHAGKQTQRIYAGGAFTQEAGTGLPIQRVAYSTDGARNWRELGFGLGGTVNTVYEWNGVPHAGGSFLTDGQPLSSVPVIRAARFNGTAWETLGTGTTGNPLSIIEHTFPAP